MGLSICGSFHMRGFSFGGNFKPCCLCKCTKGDSIMVQLTRSTLEIPSHIRKSSQKRACWPDLWASLLKLPYAKNMERHTRCHDEELSLMFFSSSSHGHSSHQVLTWELNQSGQNLTKQTRENGMNHWSQTSFIKVLALLEL